MNGSPSGNPSAARILGGPLFAGCALLACASGAAGGEIKVSAPDTKIANLIPITVAAPAGCAAVSDRLALLAVGSKPGKEPHVTLHRLDAQGLPAAAAPTALTLPRPPALARAPSYPVALAFHPRLPLLYVWQDVDVKHEYGVPADAAACKEFDHLLVYNVAQAPPALVQALAHGPEFAVGVKGGAIALNAAADRLWVPNLVGEPGKPSGSSGFGCYALNAAGLPVAADGKTTGAVGLRRRTPHGSYSLAYFPCGAGFVLLDRDVVITTCYVGPITWDEHNRQSPFNALLIRTFTGAYGSDRIAGHPTHPVIYQSTVNTSWVVSMEHVDGYMTLVPQRLVIEGATLESLPVVMAKRNQVAVGGTGRVHVLDLDDQGRFKTTMTQALVPNASAEALCYSPRFDRLYVPVEKSK